MLEAYQAYTDYQGIMDLTQEVITEAAKAVNGSRRNQSGATSGNRLGQLAAHDHARSHHQVLARKGRRQAGDERLRNR